MQKFQQSVANMPQALPSGTRTNQIITLGRLLNKNAVHKILLNIHIATMHLTDIMALSDNGGVGKIRVLILHRYSMN